MATERGFVATVDTALYPLRKALKNKEKNSKTISAAFFLQRNLNPNTRFSWINRPYSAKSVNFIPIQLINTMHNPSQLLQSRLTALGDEKKACWLENYVKHDIRSKGVGIPQIREVVKAVAKEHGLNQQPTEAQFDLLSDLMQQPFTEDKLAAILYLQLYWKGMDAQPQLDLISHWFDQRWISDWNVCDWLCVRLLSPMVDRSPEQALPVLKAWNADEYLWTARASLVPFAQCKSIAEHIDTIEAFSSILIQREERFCKTSVGWVLREYSRHDKDFVLRFLEEHKDWVTPEVVKNATKYIS